MTYTKYPQACKALMAFMMEADQFNNWLEAAKGYFIHSLNAYDASPVWNDPKRIVFRDLAKRSLTDAGLGSVGERAATAIADYGARHVCELLHRPRGRQGCYQDCRASVATYISLIVAGWLWP
jgi:hypothetical protein